jgi:hypothetical protein
MATDLENMQTALANVSAKIAEITENMRPTYSIDGQSVSWAEYYAMLMKTRESIVDAINKLDPYVVISAVI